MDSHLLELDQQQRQFFDDNGYLMVKGYYDDDRVAELRRHFHQLVTRIDGLPKAVSVNQVDPPDGYRPDPFNPHGVQGMMNQPLASDFWFDQFTEPGIVGAMADLLGPNIDFHNGKVRNKVPGFTCTQSWHQDWPYVRHSRRELAAAITYLDPTDHEAGATEVIPGSHLRGEWPTNADGHTVAVDAVDDDDGVVLAANAGDVVIIHVMVVHRAGHNYTGRSRNAIINQYKTAETIDEWGNSMAYAGLPLARNRQLLMPRVQSFT